MPDWLMLILYLGAIFLFCVFMAACGLNGEKGALGCGTIIFVVVMVIGAWKFAFGHHALFAFGAFVVLLFIGFNTYQSWKDEKKKPER